jgi:hypothetical protein
MLGVAKRQEAAIHSSKVAFATSKPKLNFGATTRAWLAAQAESFKVLSELRVDPRRRASFKTSKLQRAIVAKS